MLAPHLVAALDALEPVSHAGKAFRHIAPDRHPLSGAGARTYGGRWNPPQSFATLYLGLDPATVAAEFVRMAARQGRAPSDFLPRRLYTYRVKLHALVDLTDSCAWGALGLSERDLHSDDPSACRAIGEAAQHLGREGILAPSATGVGRVLAVFTDRLLASSLVEATDHAAWEQPPSIGQ